MQRQFFLKWLEPTHPALNGVEFRLVEQGLVTAEDSAGRTVGLCAFDLRDLDEGFVRRIESRVRREESRSLRFKLYLSPLMQYRADTLVPRNLNIEIVYTPFLNIRCAGGIFTIRTKLRVVSVDDSPVILKLLRQIMTDLKFVEVVEQVSDSRQAVATILRLQPDIVTLDIQMPGMTGVDVVKDLLPKKHFPVILISSLALEEGSLVFEALHAGAFDYLAKPKLEDRNIFSEELSSRFLAIAKGRPAQVFMQKKPPSVTPSAFRPEADLLWCLGASTGGTQALTEVFRGLPAEIPPTLVVQHIPAGFSRAFANSLNNLCPFTVKEAENGEVVRPNHVYIAPGATQMGLEQKGTSLTIAIRDDEPVNRFKPSVDYLFREVARIKNFKVVAGVMTGMGKDGANGLLELRKAGARTFAQDESTSAVYGMPRAAFENGGAEKSVSLDLVAQTLMQQSLLAKRAA